MNDLTNSESNMPGMPSMPGAPSPEETTPENVDVFTDEDADNAQHEEETKEGLVPPEHDVEEAPPIVNEVEKTIVSNVDLPVVSEKRGYEVVATRAGFYNQHRKKAGDKFIVATFEKLGTWMECIDPILEKKRFKFFEEKKKRRNK